MLSALVWAVSQHTEASKNTKDTRDPLTSHPMECNRQSSHLSPYGMCITLTHIHTKTFSYHNEVSSN